MSQSNLKLSIGKTAGYRNKILLSNIGHQNLLKFDEGLAITILVLGTGIIISMTIFGSGMNALAFAGTNYKLLWQC